MVQKTNVLLKGTKLIWLNLTDIELQGNTQNLQKTKD
jgi:hypothetical protein